jgi:hypothetical protein
LREIRSQERLADRPCAGPDCGAGFPARPRRERPSSLTLGHNSILLLVTQHIHPAPFFHRDGLPSSRIGVPTVFQMAIDHSPLPAFSLGGGRGDGLRRAVRISRFRWLIRRRPRRGINRGRSNINRRSHIDRSWGQQISAQQTGSKAQEQPSSAVMPMSVGHNGHGNQRNSQQAYKQ